MADKKKKPSGGKDDKKESPYGALQTFGKPRRFPSEKDFQECFLQYIVLCEERKEMANISGFCVYADITRDTFYQQRTHYPDSYQKVREGLQDRAINTRGNPAMGIFYLKNTFGYTDSGQIDSSSSIAVDFDADSDEIDNLMSKLGYLPAPD